jgi:hypothetical protein
VSTVLESTDHALQIKYWYSFTKLTSTSRSELLKKVSCANTPFFVRVRTKVLYFFTHNTPIHHRSTTETMSDGLQIIGQWPQEPYDTIADASPRLRCPRGCQFCRGAGETAFAEEQTWGDGGLELLFSTRCAREGDQWNSWFSTVSNRFVGRSRGRGLTGGCNNQLFGGEEGRQDTTILFWMLGANSRQTTAGLAPKHNNQQQKQSFAMTNEWGALDKQSREEEQATISQSEMEGFANLLVFLVFF